MYLSPYVYHFIQFPADVTYFNDHQRCFTLTNASLSIHNYTSHIFLLKINKKRNKYVLTFFYHLIFRICLQVQSGWEGCWENNTKYFINTNWLRF